MALVRIHILAVMIADDFRCTHLQVGIPLPGINIDYIFLSANVRIDDWQSDEKRHFAELRIVMLHSGTS